jgi:hypothetical protein
MKDFWRTAMIKEIRLLKNHEEYKKELLRWIEKNSSINDPMLGPTGEQYQNYGIPAVHYTVYLICI